MHHVMHQDVLAGLLGPIVQHQLAHWSAVSQHLDSLARPGSCEVVHSDLFDPGGGCQADGHLGRHVGVVTGQPVRLAGEVHQVGRHPLIVHLGTGVRGDHAAL